MSLTGRADSPEPASGLEVVRVLDLSGPHGALCGKLLADMGADVVRVEPPGGDPSRRFPPLTQRDGNEQGLFFWYFNTNKRSAVLDLASPGDRDQFLKLVAAADVLLESFPPGHLAALGLGEDVLFQANPGLVFVSLTDFGQTGPFHRFKGSDIVAWAMGGLMSMHGSPTREPLTAPAIQTYQCTSLWGVISTLAALLRRWDTGQGARVDLSAQEVIVDLSNPIPMSYIYSRQVLKRLGSHQPFSHPFGVYPTADGYAFIGVAPQPPTQWQTLLQWMGETVSTGDLQDPAFTSALERIKRRAEVDSVIEKWTQGLTNQEIFLKGAELGVPTAPVRRISEMLEDEQLIDREFFIQVPDPGESRNDAHPYPGLPFRRKDGKHLRNWSGPAPLLGAHTQEVIHQWKAGPPTPGPTGTAAHRRLPLEGIKVLELCWWAAGPTLGHILGDLGATVIKVERREIGDPSRGVAGGVEGLNRNTGFNATNRNKMSLTLDLRNPRGRDLFLDLARWADLAINNFTPGTLESLGIGYDALQKANPRLILSSISGYGLTGPRRSWVSFHPTAAALAGLTGHFAYDDDKAPMGFVNAYTDYVTAYMATIGTLEALLRRQRTNKGDHIDITLLETAVSLIGPEVLQQVVNGEPPQPLGNRSGALGALLQGCYACSGDDSWVVVTVPDQATLEGLARLVNQDTSVGTLSPNEVEAELARWTKSREAWEAMRLLQGAGVPAGVVSNGHDLVERDEHLKAREMFVTVNHPEIGPSPMTRNPIVLDGQPLPVRMPGPLLGQHTEYVLREVLGLSEAEYLDCVAQAVV